MKKEHLGKDFDIFLEAEGLLNEAVAIAFARIVLWKMGHNSGF